ncbi:homoserine kinase [soil metagenome]
MTYTEPEQWHATAPASSANLGPGFDCLGLALDLPFELIAPNSTDVVPEGFLLAEPTHPAAAAFVVAGGNAEVHLWWRSPIPPGRGLGFSGAARVAGAYLAHALARPGDEQWCRTGALRVAGMLEGHPDNAAASTYGGLTVAVGEQCIVVPAPDDLMHSLRAVVWSPTRSTSTDASRKVLAEQVPLEDAVFSIGRAALWVAAMASGDVSMLRTATQDRVHQPTRLAARDDTRAALDQLLARPEVLGAWLSGSGPSVAGLVRGDEPARSVAAHLEGQHVEPPGRVRCLAVDRSGVRQV